MRIADELADIRDELKAVNDSVPARAAPFRIMAPPTSSINDFWPESKQLIAVPHDLQRTISSPTSVVYIGLKLLAALCDPANSESRKGMFEKQYPWILDTCEDLWHCFHRWSTALDQHPLHDETVASYLQLITNLTIPGHRSKDSFSTSVKAATTSVKSIACLIEGLATSPMSNANQEQLALMVTRLCRNAKADQSHERVLDRRRQSSQMLDVEILKQSATRLCENAEVLSSLHKDLQVCALFTALLSSLTKNSLRFVSGSRKASGPRRSRVFEMSYAPMAQRVLPPYR